MPKLSITFKTEGKAKEFVKHFSSLSLSATASMMKGKTPKVVVNVSDDEEAKIVKSLIADIKEQAFQAKASAILIASIKNCVTEGKARNLVLRDGAVVRLIPNRAKSFMDVHDQISEENQKIMRRMVIESADAFSNIMNFCKQRSKSNGII